MLDLGPGEARFSRAADGGTLMGPFRVILLVNVVTAVRKPRVARATH